MSCHKGIKIKPTYKENFNLKFKINKKKKNKKKATLYTCLYQIRKSVIDKNYFIHILNFKFR